MATQQELDFLKLQQIIKSAKMPVSAPMSPYKSNVPTAIPTVAPKINVPVSAFQKTLGSAITPISTKVNTKPLANLGNLAINTVSAGQSVYLNAVNQLASALQGKGFQPIKSNMTYADFEKQVADRGGVKPNSEIIAKQSPLLASIYKLAMEIGTDPIELTPIGFLNDIKLAKGIGTQTTKGLEKYSATQKAVPQPIVQPKPQVTQPISEPQIAPVSDLNVHGGTTVSNAQQVQKDVLKSEQSQKLEDFISKINPLKPRDDFEKSLLLFAKYSEDDLRSVLPKSLFNKHIDGWSDYGYAQQNFEHGYDVDAMKYLTQHTSEPIESILKKLNSNVSNAPLTSSMASSKDGSELIAITKVPKKEKVAYMDTLPITPQTKLPESASKIIVGKTKETPTVKSSFEKFYNNIVDSATHIKKASDKAYLYATNSKSVDGVVKNVLENELRDSKGRLINASLKDKIAEIPKQKYADFWEYMSHRHNIDRDLQGKPVQVSHSSRESAEEVRRRELENPEYKQIGDDIVQWIDDFMRSWGVNTGIVDSNVYDSLRQIYKSYFPTQRDFSELEKSIAGGSVSRKFVDLKTPIKTATGSERDIIDPLENIMALVDRTIKTATYNRVGLSILEDLRLAPDKLKGVAEILTDEDTIAKNLDNVITVLEDGVPTYLKINDKNLLDALLGLPKNIYNVPAINKIIRGFKALITQKNPFFALRNIFRDVPTAYVYGSEANPLKFTSDLFKAGGDVLTNSEAMKLYRSMGGGGGNFFNNPDAVVRARELMSKDNIIQKIVKHPFLAIEKFNNLTETAPRLAEFNRVLKQTGDIDKAMFAAQDVTVNFSRGGNITKMIDRNFVPYLNPSVQGIDKFFRSFKNPRVALLTAAKAGIAITLPEVALYLVNRDDPNWQKLDNRTKDNYFTVPRGDGTFGKIPKTRELGVLFGSLFTRIAEDLSGAEQPYKDFGTALKTGFAPASPLQSNIVSPFINLGRNKDFANRPIVPLYMQMDSRSPYLQYDERSTETAKWFAEQSAKILGEKKSLSPKQIDYIVKSYAGILGQLGQPLDVEGGKMMDSIKNSWIADPEYNNSIGNEFYEILNNLESRASDKNIIEKIPSKQVTTEERQRNLMARYSKQIAKLNKELRSVQFSDSPTRKEEMSAIKQKIIAIQQDGVDKFKQFQEQGGE